MKSRPHQVAKLVILSGLSGAGKSSIAHRLAEATGAVWLRIDSLEQAMCDAGVLRGEVGAAGYLAAHAIAADNLRLGSMVVADCVNPWSLTRDGWHAVGIAAGARVFEVEVVCSDAAEHRRRIEARDTDATGSRRLTWEEASTRDYHPWSRERLVIDTSGAGVDDCAHLIREHIGTEVPR